MSTVGESTAAARVPRVLLVENALHWTGSFSSALFMAEALRDTHEVQVVLPTASSLHAVVREHGILCVSLPMREIGRSWKKLALYLPMLAVNSLRLRRLLARLGTDILVINDYYNLLGAAARLLGWRGTLITVVRLMPNNQHPVLNRLWSRVAISWSDKVLAVSRAVAGQLPADPAVAVVYNPVNFLERHPVTAVRASGDDEIHCLYLANYIEGKGHEDALEAFAAAHAFNRQLRLRYVGGDMGLPKNRALRDRLEQRVRKMGLEGAVTVCGSTSDPEKEIKDCDIVLNFSHSESFSHTCLEASAFGRAVIATRCGGPAEIIADGVTGLLVNVGDRPAMTAALQRLAADPEERRRMGLAGRDLVRQRFSFSEFTRAFEQFTCAAQEPVRC